ncbi:uncharacterized protein PITG_20980 [Phytophthora infestans T30-4]|uniref:Uncharacterized protein n=1 Tax=Phytophthora infestans (strain T30-4) TaxID=403677 RepID=D0P3H2_PHYIT|nr:uncharacterized protein PITG_20980 [Phytophthora infestans T30-4]EEY59760.1 conserved hypothetical protein [Phytophthora infestans T30-4]|eukprot:XP_002895152.1 conserved hypothetical protein [Phytophthora infestans T30-4]
MQAQVTPPSTPTGSVSQPPRWAPERCNTKRIDSAKMNDDHFQQVPHAQAPWQSTSHLPERRMMVQRILQLSQSRSKPDVSPDRAVLLTKRIELALYSRAGSLAEYSNLATLRRRLQSLVALSVHESAASETVVVHSRKRRVVARNLLQVNRAMKRRRCTNATANCSIFAMMGEDCTRLVFSFLDGKEIIRNRTLNRFAAKLLPSCALSLTVEVVQLTRGLARNSSLLQMTNLQQLVVHKAEVSSVVPKVGLATTPLYAWGCAELPPNQANDGESAVLALAGALTTGAFPNLKKLQLISVFVNTMSRNGIRALCGAVQMGWCPLLEDLLLAGNSLAELRGRGAGSPVAVRSAPRLTRLDCVATHGESGLRAVLSALSQSSPSLKVLCMGGNLVTDNCVNELQRLLAGSSPVLRFLGLEDNFLSAQGVQLVLETAAVINASSTRTRRGSCDRGASA